jgi:hypothetical protein
MNLDYINILNDDVIGIILSFIDPRDLIFVSKNYYVKYNYLIDDLIKDARIENYIRDMFKNENVFVMKMIIERHFDRWIKTTNYFYNNNIFYDYVAFLKYYCYINSSIESMAIINDKLEETGLQKKRSKNNIIKNNKWNK